MAWEKKMKIIIFVALHLWLNIRN